MPRLWENKWNKKRQIKKKWGKWMKGSAKGSWMSGCVSWVQPACWRSLSLFSPFSFDNMSLQPSLKAAPKQLINRKHFLVAPSLVYSKSAISTVLYKGFCDNASISSCSVISLEEIFQVQHQASFFYTSRAISSNASVNFKAMARPLALYFFGMVSHSCGQSTLNSVWDNEEVVLPTGRLLTSFL